MSGMADELAARRALRELDELAGNADHSRHAGILAGVPARTSSSSAEPASSSSSSSWPPAATFAAVVAIDTAAKVALTVPAGLEHRRPAGLAAAGLVVAAAVAVIGFRWPARFATPAALIAAGAACNLVWLLAAGAVPDPLLAASGGTFVAFNPADIAIAAGGLLAAARVAAGLLELTAARLEADR